jgi:large subunit ribosomal protein L6
MSRIGKRPVEIPKGVTVTIENGVVKVKGAKGELSMPLPNMGYVDTKVAGDGVVVSRRDESREARREQGLVRALIANMVSGVTKTFSKDLDIVGVGYRAEVKGNNLNLSLGYSHPVEFPIPKGIQIVVDKMTHITVSGASKSLVGETAACIRRLRPPEPYKGKGIKYSTETIKRKVGKAAVGTTGAAAK